MKCKWSETWSFVLALNNIHLLQILGNNESLVWNYEFEKQRATHDNAAHHTIISSNIASTSQVSTTPTSPKLPHHPVTLQHVQQCQENLYRKVQIWAKTLQKTCKGGLFLLKFQVFSLQLCGKDEFYYRYILFDLSTF